MTTAYTRAELDAFEALFESHLPPVPVVKDIERLPMVVALAGAGAPTGLLLRLEIAGGDTAPLFLNPVVALEFLLGVQRCAEDGGWWKAGQSGRAAEPAADLTPEDANNPNDILSLTTASAANAMLVHMARQDGSHQMFGLDRRDAMLLALIINMAAEKFGWWDKDFVLQPYEGASARITDKEVWAAAQQVIDQATADPEIEASQRADASYEQGDMFNFDLWGRVSLAVKELLRQKSGQDTVN